VVGHDRGVDEGHTIDLSDNPSRVIVHGMTPKGLRVALVTWDADLNPDTPSPYEDWPEGDREMPRRLGRYLVEVTDASGIAAVVGMVSWHLESYGPTPGSHAWNIGIGLIEAVRGHGIGTVAQRLLAEWLLETTYVDRIEASTDVENVGEQRALERAGFTQEGILRSAQERADGRHDLFGYSFLRDDLEAKT
jgi:RimJ/RimL family protein N-acetyltransferase